MKRWAVSLYLHITDRARVCGCGKAVAAGLFTLAVSDTGEIISCPHCTPGGVLK